MSLKSSAFNPDVLSREESSTLNQMLLDEYIHTQVILRLLSLYEHILDQRNNKNIYKTGVWIDIERLINMDELITNFNTSGDREGKDKLLWCIKNLIGDIKYQL